MKPSRKIGLALLGLAAGLLTAGSALAWGHSRVSIGFGFGFPYYYPGPYYSPYYYPPAYYPPSVVVQQPPVYVERQDAAAPEAQNYWYYCAGSKTYYPYVKECPAGWQKVPATPAPR